MSDCFLCGPLAHAPLRAVVLGHEVAGETAFLPGYAATCHDQAACGLYPAASGQCEGVLIRNASADEVARLEFYLNTAPCLVSVQLGTRKVEATAFVQAGAAGGGAPWNRADWLAQWGDIAVAVAGDVMALYGQVDAAEVAARRGAMGVRGASRVRAGDAAPTALRHRASPGDVTIARRRLPYANFFSVEEYDLSYRSFAGAHGPVVNRAVFVSGDAVTVLPYDPVRDRVLLVEQFRPGPMARGDAQPWLLEPIAGRIDPGETPVEAAVREAAEEAGIGLGEMLFVGGYYPSPGAKAEYLYSYVALADLPDGVAGVFGLAEEAEDIRGHILPFDAMMDLVASGEIANGPLLVTALWLQRERPALRQAADLRN